MLDIFSWFSDNEEYKDKPWLIMGKGPTLSNIYNYSFDSYKLLSLNHVVENHTVTLAHFIDIDVVLNVQKKMYENAEFVVIPWVPHVNNQPGKKSLGEIIDDIPVLKKLDFEGRLLTYNLSTSPLRFNNSKLVRAIYFSSEAALSILISANVTMIRTIGIDGGDTYCKEFNYLDDKTLLSNKRKTFDSQFKEFPKLISHKDIDFSPIDIESPVNIFVASTDEQMLSVKVLEYSIRKHATVSVRVTPLHKSRVEIPVPEKKENRSRTPFSFQRFLIPEMSSYHGRAIYLDSDMQVFSDIKELWCYSFGTASVLSTKHNPNSNYEPQYSVMLLNCNDLKWDIKNIIKDLDDGKISYSQLLHEMSLGDSIERKIHADWNSFESYTEGETSLLHYTNMITQPWVSTVNPSAYLWCRDLFESIKHGFISIDYVKDEVRKQNVRPSLLYQIENSLEDPLLLPKHIRKLDDAFIAPYHSITSDNGRLFRNFVKAKLRNYYELSKVKHFISRVKNFYMKY